MSVAFIFSLLFSVLVVVFALQNSAIVTINFLFVEHSISQALVILISAIFGAIIVLLLSMVKQIKSNIKIRNLTKTIHKSEEAERILKEKEEKIQRGKLEEENRLLREQEEATQKEMSEMNNNNQENSNDIK
ncbi:hypothetical protein Amet_3668 [Alkaliphilus metalliredigens QYMF]|uniref:Lipopolysaccharide assembly protein A domain-containing protein n=1 Tax=Alkaliphilus metalliredigens (strain QYMF) TaxID=293826 RepID=A6TUC0_ALKMQ|nr:LapA family protein [Alkaliphilus metalliredigens]ABR49788.1 hypothetical protein Amet_3668 [Alkaliphilus metalliredigens QYMF]